MKGWMYILECSDGSYYTGSTNNLKLRLRQHQTGKGANHTKKRLPVKLVYCEAFHRIDEAFYREKQIQGWRRKKKEALINGMPERLHELAKCLNESSHRNFAADYATFGYAQAAEDSDQETKNNEDHPPATERSRSGRKEQSDRDDQSNLKKK